VVTPLKQIDLEKELCEESHVGKLGEEVQSSWQFVKVVPERPGTSNAQLLKSQ
jgi:hypothetical protein